MSRDPYDRDDSLLHLYMAGFFVVCLIGAAALFVVGLACGHFFWPGGTP